MTTIELLKATRCVVVSRMTKARMEELTELIKNLKNIDQMIQQQSILENFKALGPVEARKLLREITKIVDQKVIKELNCGTTVRLCRLIKDYVLVNNSVYESGTLFYVPVKFSKPHCLDTESSNPLEDNAIFYCIGLPNVFLVPGDYFELV